MGSVFIVFAQVTMYLENRHITVAIANSRLKHLLYIRRVTCMIASRSIHSKLYPTQESQANYWSSLQLGHWFERGRLFLREGINRLLHIL